jgi:hypothetical protein
MRTSKPKKFKPKSYTPRSLVALCHYAKPIPMLGDPSHNGTWQDKSKRVYEHMMKIKRGEIQP